MKNYTRSNNVISEVCNTGCDFNKNKHGKCDTCKAEFLVFESINKAKRKSRALQSSGHSVSKA